MKARLEGTEGFNVGEFKDGILITVIQCVR